MKTNLWFSRVILGFVLIISTSACSEKASFVAINNNGPTSMTVEGKEVVQLPAELDIKQTTFGQYQFTVTDNDSEVSGLLPLLVSPPRIVLDILFFAPALFFNIQGPCEKYTFYMDTGKTLCEKMGNRIERKMALETNTPKPSD